MLESRPSLDTATMESSPAPGRVLVYAEALAAMVVALAITDLLRERLEGTRLLILWVMSAWVSWRGGFRAVAVASVLGVLLWDLLLRGDIGRLEALTSTDAFGVLVYVGVSLIMGRTFDSLRAERRRVVEATDQMLDAMYVFDGKWRLQFYNRAGAAQAQRVGLPLGSLRGKVIWDVLPRLRGTQFETEPRRARDENRVVEFEARIPDANIWLRTRAVPTPDGGLTLFSHDISARERAESDLRRSEERYRALVQASTVMVWSTDAMGAGTDVPVFHEITGQTTEELRTAGWLEAIHPDDRRHVISRWAEAQREGSSYVLEYRLRQPDGSWHWYRVRAVPIKDGDEVREWVGVLDDINEQYVARERHRAVENALAVLGVSLDYEWNLAAVTRLLVPSLADYCSVDIVDIDGEIKRVSSTHVDPAKEVVLRELWAKYPYRTGDPGSPEVIATGVAQMSPDVDPTRIDAFARNEEHAEMLRLLAPRSFICVPMSTRGQVFGALALVYSDSGRTHADADQAAVEQVAARAAIAIENARLYAEAQAGSRAKSDFLATMSHELRTPLNAIAGYAELLLMGVRGPVSDEQRRDLVRIRQNQQHLLEIITDILNFSRIEAGRTQYEIAEVNVADVLGRMEGVIEPQARARSIAYTCTPPDTHVSVRADREKLEQVLINLLGNAVKFTPAGGTVHLTAEVIDARVRIEVRDTGVGIPASQLSSIFEPFVQLEPALTRTSEGTGLGLAISRELARGMGGELRAESVPGKGSTFLVELPRADSPAPSGD